MTQVLEFWYWSSARLIQERRQNLKPSSRILKDLLNLTWIAVLFFSFFLKLSSYSNVCINRRWIPEPLTQSWRNCPFDVELDSNRFYIQRHHENLNNRNADCCFLNKVLLLDFSLTQAFAVKFQNLMIKGPRVFIWGATQMAHPQQPRTIPIRISRNCSTKKQVAITSTKFFFRNN